MSLPGLQLSAPVESVSLPIIHELKEGSEWRFEVAFGSKVDVKVRPGYLAFAPAVLTFISAPSYSPAVQSYSVPNWPKSRYIPLPAPKQPSTPGMAAVLRSQATVKSTIARKKRP